MRKFFIIFSLFIGMTLHLMAGQLDIKEAQTSALRFLSSQASSQHNTSHSTPEIRLVHIEGNSSRLNQPVYYIFNTEEGFIIVSADDNSREILAYGDSPIDMAHLPENMKFWLTMYKQEIEFLQLHPNEFGNSFKDRNKSPGASNVLSVEPLLSAKWDQGSPYNKLCPILPFADNLLSLTGCGATSVSMIFHHWKYPVDMIPEIGGYIYLWRNYSIELPSLPPVTFDWDNMLDVYNDGSYNDEQAYAVALLMRHVGQAEEMMYTPEGGSSQDDNILEAIKFFGYDDCVEMKVKATTDGHGYEEELINDDDWAAILQDELLERRPVLYLAFRPIEADDAVFGIIGHAFCVDGYDAKSDTYHVNWGWSGKADGYFALNAFNGNSQLYNIAQSMIIGIEPPAELPTIKVRPRIALESYVNEVSSTTFNVNGRLLTDDVNLALNDVDGVFALDVTTISAADALAGKTVTVTYSPRDLGTHTATIVFSSTGATDTTLTIQGTSKLEVYTPTLMPVDSSYIYLTQFRADWIDKTTEENVESYTLEVSTNPSVMQLAVADFSDYPDVIGNLASSVEQYIPEGWTYDGGGFWLDGGCIEVSPGSTLTSKVFDLSQYDKVTVVVTAKNWSAYRKPKLTIASSEESLQFSISNSYDDYIAVLDCNDLDSISFTAGGYYSSYYIMIQKIEIYAGELDDSRLRNTSEEGDANYRLISGITDKSYLVEGLTPGNTYFYKVKAHYSDGSDSPWSMARMVTLFDENHNYKLGDVNHDGNVNISDVMALINGLLGDSGNICPICSDINHDGLINILDVTELINNILSGS